MSTRKAAKKKIAKLPKGEAEQVRVRRDLGHDFALRNDEHGRLRLAAGTAEASRVYEVSNDGHTSTGGIARVRNSDPLKGIPSLTDRQRAAGTRYREDFEAASREGVKAGAMRERVDGGRQSANVSARLLDNHATLFGARRALAYDEIVHVLDMICGLGMSISQLATLHGSSRDIPTQLLRMGLEKLVEHYSIASGTKGKH